MNYKRIVLKLSGESLMGDKNYGIDTKRLTQYAVDIKEAKDLGIDIAVVIGGGNIYRGIQAKETGISRVQGDYMGMLATVINAMALQSSLEKMDINTRLMSPIRIDQVAEFYTQRQAVSYLNEGKLVIFGGGTGSPYFTTDSTASLRAVEINADAVLKGTRVDGVYSGDPEKDPSAKKFSAISFKKVYEMGLQVMDMTAFTLCRENNLPIVVFDMNKPGNLKRLLKDNNIGTLISE